MQKQLTIRDWILYSLLSLLILLLVLAMYHIDRQWLKLTEMQTSMSEQAKSLRELRSVIASGAVSAASPATAEKNCPGFQTCLRSYPFA